MKKIITRDKNYLLKGEKIQQYIAISRDQQKDVFGQNTTWENLILSKLSRHFFASQSE